MAPPVATVMFAARMTAPVPRPAAVPPAPLLAASVDLSGLPEEFDPPATREFRLRNRLKDHPDDADLKKKAAANDYPSRFRK